MNTPNKRRTDKGRLNFRINPVLYDRLADFCRENGMKTVSEGAWFLLNAAMIDRAEKQKSPPPHGLIL